jgi:hypothetical protein
MTSSFCSYRTSCPFLDHIDTIPVLQCPDTASIRALKMCSLRVRAPLMRARALTFIEVLGVSGLSTLVHVGDWVLAVSIDILLHVSCVQTLT